MIQYFFVERRNIKLHATFTTDFCLQIIKVPTCFIFLHIFILLQYIIQHTMITMT